MQRRSQIWKVLQIAGRSRRAYCAFGFPQVAASPSSNPLRSTCRVNPMKEPLNVLRRFSSFPPHKVVMMPSLSPTMESGSISKWNVKEGDKFDVGVSFCDVETDKATVSFDATDEGIIAKILVTSGEVKVGQPILITVEDDSVDVKAFSSYSPEASKSASLSAAPSPPPKNESSSSSLKSGASTSVTAHSFSQKDANQKIFASPLARKLIRESNHSLEKVHSALGGQGSGANNRLVASDVLKGLSSLSSQKSSSVSPVEQPARKADLSPSTSTSSPYSDFELSESAQILASRLASNKQTVPHYYVSVEINLSNLMKMREQMNSRLSHSMKGGEFKGLSVLDFLIKGTAVAVKQVPDVNAAWMDTYVRRYDQVDVNVVMGSGSLLATPVIKDVGSKGLLSIAGELESFENSLNASDPSAVEKFLRDEKTLSVGTLSIHNLGSFGVKSAAPIVLLPQSCALAFGTIVDTVIPSAVNEKGWEVAPMMIATLSCDHRVVDGAVSAQYLSVFKNLIENPENLIL